MTTRDGGGSAGPWAGMNLGLGCGDDRDTVIANRARLATHLPSEPAWLQQVHGTTVVDAARVDAPVQADASYSALPHVVCAVLVADCMPVLFASADGTRVAAAHAGWRGLAAGVLEATLAASGLDPAETMAWLGPAIGPRHFEVGDDVRRAFVDAPNGDEAATAFKPKSDGKWLADLAHLARLRLAGCGVCAVLDSGLCTASEPKRFYSYRRDGVTGRMAALIWIDR